ncbi:hypothetical protein PS35CTX_1140 (plasmid) [Escherichia coli]
MTMNTVNNMSTVNQPELKQPEKAVSSEDIDNFIVDVFKETGHKISKDDPVISLIFLDHKTGETATETLTQRELVARLKQHIPEKFFKMVRYFGFLANRVCGEKLPQVYRALGMDKPEPVAKVCYAQMVKQFLSRDPFECVLCGCRMVYRRAIAGLNVSGLKKNARDISLLRYMPA